MPPPPRPVSYREISPSGALPAPLRPSWIAAQRPGVGKEASVIFKDYSFIGMPISRTLRLHSAIFLPPPSPPAS